MSERITRLLNMHEWLDELEALRARDIDGENLSDAEYNRMDELRDRLAEGYAEEAKKYDTP